MKKAIAHILLHLIGTRLATSPHAKVGKLQSSNSPQNCKPKYTTTKK